MAMDKRKRIRQPTMWVPPTDLPTTPSHPPQDVQLGDSERLPGEKPVQDRHEPAIPIEREQPRNRRFENEEDEARLPAANPHLEASSSRCWTRSGVPISYTSKILGHTNLSTASPYLNTHRRGLQEAMRKLEGHRGAVAQRGIGISR
jgi:hypothetical protein